MDNIENQKHIQSGIKPELAKALTDFGRGESNTRIDTDEFEEAEDLISETSVDILANKQSKELALSAVITAGKKASSDQEDSLSKARFKASIERSFSANTSTYIEMASKDQDTNALEAAFQTSKFLDTDKKESNFKKLLKIVDSDEKASRKGSGEVSMGIYKSSESSESKIKAMELVHKSFSTDVDKYLKGDESVTVEQIESYSRFYADLLTAKKDKEAREQGYLGVGSKLEEMGVESPKSMMQAWRFDSDKAQQPGLYEKRVSENIQKVLRLEKDMPGIVSHLDRNYGIKTLGRYKDSDMKKIFDEDKYIQENNIDLVNYGLVISAMSDETGAFHGSTVVTDTLEKADAMDLSTRYIEAVSPEEAKQRKDKLENRFGKKPKFMIIVAHGEPNGIYFGPLVPDHKLNVSDVQDPNKKFWENDIPTLMDSCSVGAEKGIAESMGIKGVAPMETSSINGFDFALDSRGDLVFTNIQYKGEGTFNVATKVYK